MVSEPYYATLSDAELKEQANRLVAELAEASPGHQAAVLSEIAIVREEMIDRLWRRGGDGDGQGGVREPRRPHPGGDGAHAVVFGDHD